MMLGWVGNNLSKLPTVGVLASLANCTPVVKIRCELFASTPLSERLYSGMLYFTGYLSP